MTRKKPTTCKVSLWNITGSIHIDTHADEPHKSVALVDLTVNLGDSNTVHDLVMGIANILELPEPQRDWLRHHIVQRPDKLKKLADAFLVEQVTGGVQ